MIQRPLWPLLAVVGFSLLSPASAADTELETRLGRLERIVENRGGSELVLQMQQLQQEMQQLRGLVEAQQFEIQALKRQQRENYLDLERRLSALSAPEEDSRADPPESAQSQAPEPPDSGQPAVSEPSATRPGDAEREAYGTAFSLLKEGRYPEASAAFEDFLTRYPQGRYADAAQYWLGESQYIQRDYAAALKTFSQLVRTRSSSTRVPAALLRIGDIELEQGALEQARTSFERLIDAYPNSREAQLARERLERLR